MDRRIIFLLVFIAVTIPLLFPIGLQTEVSPPVQNTYDFIDKLPPDSKVWFGFDYYATTTTECSPQAYAVIRHLFSKNMRIIATSLIPDGATISQEILNDVALEYNKTYGKDYVILGYKSGGMVAIKQMCENMQGIFPSDVLGRSTREIPLMQQVKNFEDIDFLFTVTDNASFDQYVTMASTTYHIPMAGGTTAVSVPGLYPYLDSGQAVGLLGGLKGGAEYEKLIGIKGTATKGMDAQSVVHLLIAALIIFSNIIYFMAKKKREEE